MSGISLAQGPHQLAQKFSSTGLPLKSARVRVAPSASVMVKSGVGGCVGAVAVTVAGVVGGIYLGFLNSIGAGDLYLLVVGRWRAGAL